MDLQAFGIILLNKRQLGITSTLLISIYAKPLCLPLFLSRTIVTFFTVPTCSKNAFTSISFTFAVN
jgi:hypothetical protein